MPKDALRIAVIPGDGVGAEVVAETLPLLEQAAALEGCRVEAVQFSWGSTHYRRHGTVMPADGPDRLRGFDAVLFGAVGDPDLPDDVIVRQLIIRLRQELDLAVNVRPIRSWPGVPGPFGVPPDADLLIVRENTEGEYTGAGGRAHRGSPDEVGIEVAVHSRAAIERAARFAFEQASSRRGHLTSVTKSNVMRFGYALWDEVVAGIARSYPQVRWEPVLVDAMALRLVERPESLDVVLASNLFGDILSDLAAVLAGGLGMAPSANIRPDRDAPGVYEPVHGSAPDIAGRGIANPAACILSAALLLEHAGLVYAAQALRDGVAATVQDAKVRTPDLRGEGTTAVFAAHVAAGLPSVRGAAPR